MVRDARPWITACCVISCALLLAGCQPSGEPGRLHSAPQDSADQRNAIAKLTEMIHLGKAVGEANDPELVCRMERLSWAMSLAGGYDFRGHFELWDLWLAWLAHRDFGVIRKCLDSRNPTAVTLAIDIAFNGGRNEDYELVMRRYEVTASQGNEELTGTYRYTIGTWLTYHRPISATGDNAGFERVVSPTDKFCRRVLELMKSQEGEMREIRAEFKSRFRNRNIALAPNP